MSLVLEVSFLAIPVLTGRKADQKEGFGSKCVFFFRKKGLKPETLMSPDRHLLSASQRRRHLTEDVKVA